MNDPFEIVRLGKKIGLEIGISGRNFKKEDDSPLNKIILPDQIPPYYQIYRSKTRYKRAVHLLTCLSARALETNGDTKVNNAWVKECLKEFGSISDRQICNLFKHLVKHKQIAVELTKYRRYDKNGKPMFFTRKGVSYPLYAHSRMVRVWQVFAYKRFRTMPGIFENDTRPNSKLFIGKIPHKWTTSSEFTTRLPGGKMYSVTPVWQGKFDAVRKGVINGRVFDFYERLQYLRHNKDPWATKMLGYKPSVWAKVREYRKKKRIIKNGFIPNQQTKISS